MSQAEEVSLCRTEPPESLGLPSWFCAGDEILDLIEHIVLSHTIHSWMPPLLTSQSPRSCLLRERKEIRADGRTLLVHPQQGHKLYAQLPLYPHKVWGRGSLLVCQVGSEFLGSSDPLASVSKIIGPQRTTVVHCSHLKVACRSVC